MQVSPIRRRRLSSSKWVYASAGTGARPHYVRHCKDSTVRILLSHQRGHFFLNRSIEEFSKLSEPQIRIRGIDSPSLHFGPAGRAGEGRFYNIEKIPSTLFQQLHTLPCGLPKIAISGVNAQRLAKPASVKGLPREAPPGFLIFHSGWVARNDNPTEP